AQWFAGEQGGVGFRPLFRRLFWQQGEESPQIYVKEEAEEGGSLLQAEKYCLLKKYRPLEKGFPREQHSLLGREKKR
ncbi:MAG: hypothetical protein FWB81_02830, partial [Cystobacterineae bacterium]|nr:hypothetical protein [Cystobacterineae bacterium]